MRNYFRGDRNVWDSPSLARSSAGPPPGSFPKVSEEPLGHSQVAGLAVPAAGLSPGLVPAGTGFLQQEKLVWELQAAECAWGVGHKRGAGLCDPEPVWDWEALVPPAAGGYSAKLARKGELMDEGSL